MVFGFPSLKNRHPVDTSTAFLNTDTEKIQSLVKNADTEKTFIVLKYRHCGFSKSIVQ